MGGIQQAVRDHRNVMLVFCAGNHEITFLAAVWEAAIRTYGQAMCLVGALLLPLQSVAVLLTAWSSAVIGSVQI